MARSDSGSGSGSGSGSAAEAGETALAALLAGLAPLLLAGDYVFCTVESAQYVDCTHLQPLASFQEAEGLSLVLSRETAEGAGLAYSAVMRCITLGVHSSLEAVGLTAAVATTLAQRGISANVIAAYHHDHVLVPAAQAQEAMAALQALVA